MTPSRLTMAVMVALLACLLASCAREEPAAVTSQDRGAGTSALPESSQQLLGLLPAKDDVPGWLMKGNPKLAGPGNLWELIDGAAEGYLTYGFQEAVSVHFSSGSHELVVDAYRMKDSLNAFGIYAQERNPEAQFITTGVEGYLSGTVLNFWAAAYYVKITAFDDQEPTQEAMRKIAAAISGKIGPAGSEPAEVAWFPKENQLPRSVTYIPKDVLGQSYFVTAFEARYKAGRVEYKLLVIDLHDAGAATQALATYRQFMSGQGKTPKDLAMQGSDEGFSGEDSFYGQVMAVRSGRFIAIALGAPSPVAGRTALEQVLNRVPRKTEVS